MNRFLAGLAVVLLVLISVAGVGYFVWDLYHASALPAATAASVDVDSRFAGIDTALATKADKAEVAALRTELGTKLDASRFDDRFDSRFAVAVEPVKADLTKKVDAAVAASTANTTKLVVLEPLPARVDALEAKLSAAAIPADPLTKEKCEMLKRLMIVAAGCAAILTTTPPVVPVAYAGGPAAPPLAVEGCTIEVAVHSKSGTYPAAQITAWANGGKIRGVLRGAASPGEGSVYVPVSCDFRFGNLGEVCFGTAPGMARKLLPSWFLSAQANYNAGQRVLNAGVPSMVLGFVED